MASNTLFVSNFPFATTEDDLRATFEAFGSVSNIRIIIDRQTGRSRGYAFVELAEAPATDQAIETLNETTFRGRKLVVTRARSRTGGPETGPSDAGQRSEPFRHRIVIEWSDDASAYRAEVPELGIAELAASLEAALRQAKGKVLAARPEEDAPTALSL